jgi:hypothetical protein
VFKISEEESVSKNKLHVRYEWLDQFRGLIIIFLIISVITWPLSGDPSMPGSTWIGPPLLNHGFKYFNGYPPLITIIDIGQQIFMFILGFVGYLAFKSRLEKKGSWAAWKHGMIRVAILYGLAFLDDGLIGGLILNGSIPWDEVLWYGTLANLAIGSFAAYLATYIIRKNASYRMYLSIGIMTIHAILYATGLFKYKFDLLSGGSLFFPFNAFNHAAIAISGTSFSQWLKKDPDNLDIGFKRRILPASTIAIIAFYCFDWIQPAEHHDATTSLALLAIGASGFLITIFYGFDKLKFKVPLLSEMGKNMLLLFILAFIWDFIIDTVADSARDFLLNFPAVTMICFGVLPILIEGGIAYLLARWDIKIKI